MIFSTTQTCFEQIVERLEVLSDCTFPLTLTRLIPKCDGGVERCSSGMTHKTCSNRRAALLYTPFVSQATLKAERVPKIELRSNESKTSDSYGPVNAWSI